jgi:hypothetical protein
MPWERSLLKKLYPDDPELWVYATRDSDGEGLLDFWPVNARQRS